MVQDFSYPTDTFLLLGKVGKAHGLRGEVKIFSFSGQPGNLSNYKEIVLVSATGTISAAMEIEAVRVHGKTAIVKLATIDSRDHAEEIEGRGVLLAKELLPKSAEGEYYWYQYEGKVVVDLEGQTIGRVSNIFNNGAQDLLVVMAGEKEYLIPVTKEIVVKETDDELTIDPPPGLLELAYESDDQK